MMLWLSYNLQSVFFVWAWLAQVTLALIKPNTISGKVAVFVAWPLVLLAAAIIVTMRELRRARDFPRPVIVRYRRSSHLCGREHERPTPCIGSTTGTEHP